MTIEENVPLAPFTTFRIGGAARFFVRVQCLKDLEEAITFAQAQNLRILILGGGSNMLVDDEGFDGICIKIETKGIIVQREEEVIVVAEAGESWDALVLKTVEESLWGLENLSGIPGTVGAAPVQNIGAYGVELKDSLLWAEVFEIKTGKVQKFSNRECDFSYRYSFFKKHPGEYCILRVAFKLQTTPSPQLTYKDLATIFTETSSVSLSSVREAVLSIRRQKFPDLSVEGTAGSFFLNPIVSKKKVQELLVQFPELPNFQTNEGIKISLAWILDHVLHYKGYRLGAARLFEAQPLILVADVSSSSTAVLQLSDRVIEKIKEVCDIVVEKEVQYIK